MSDIYGQLELFDGEDFDESDLLTLRDKVHGGVTLAAFAVSVTTELVGNHGAEANAVFIGSMIVGLISHFTSPIGRSFLADATGVPR